MADLSKKYPREKIAKIRTMFDSDVQWWARIKHQSDLDAQCCHTGSDDPMDVAGPWPQGEWEARHAKGNERPCLHEDILTPFGNQVVNQIEMNPMGVEVQPAGDGADAKDSEFLEGRIRHWEYEERAQQAYLGAVQPAVMQSYGWWKLETYYRGEFGRRLCCEPIADPNTIVPGFFKKRDASDMRRAWEIERMTHAEFREKFPKAKLKSFSGLGVEAPQWIDDQTIQVAAWWHLEEDERELLRIDGPEGSFTIYRDELPDEPSGVSERRTEKQHKIIKTIFNGVEAIDETEWMDPGDRAAGIRPEIPLFLVAGRITYTNGKMDIGSLVRNGRMGQLLYDYCISSMQEELAQIPKAKAWGPEGSFDTSTDWMRLGRNPVAYAEWKLVYDTNGNRAEKPEFVEYTPKVDALELAKQSIQRGIQNAIGMASAERKDRSAKSGKALDQLAEEMTIGTAHYFASLRVAQERQYRMVARILPVIDADEQEVGTRDKFGRHEMTQPAYKGRHAVTIGAGRLYQNLQDKQEEFAEELLKIGDPMILLVALTGISKMKGIGEFGDHLHKIFVKLLISAKPELAEFFPDAQPEEPNPAAEMAQMQQAMTALNAHSEQLEGAIQKLMKERDAKIAELENKKDIAIIDKEKAIAVAEINASIKEDIGRIESQLGAFRHVMDFLSAHHQIENQNEQADMGRQHEKDMAAQSAQNDAIAASSTAGAE